MKEVKKVKQNWKLNHKLKSSINIQYEDYNEFNNSHTSMIGNNESKESIEELDSKVEYSLSTNYDVKVHKIIGEKVIK